MKLVTVKVTETTIALRTEITRDKDGMLVRIVGTNGITYVDFLLEMKPDIDNFVDAVATAERSYREAVKS